MASTCARVNSGLAFATALDVASLFATLSLNALSISLRSATVRATLVSSTDACPRTTASFFVFASHNASDCANSLCADAVVTTPATTTVMSSILPPRLPPPPSILFNPPNNPTAFGAPPLSVSLFAASRAYGESYFLSSACLRATFANAVAAACAPEAASPALANARVATSTISSSNTLSNNPSDPAMTRSPSLTLKLKTSASLALSQSFASSSYAN
mmetsp:Transcript_5907/g.21347  ORF Transcript_5907/g.21347 Transcript_5907/m.21347 type:complete len:217 (+) Transcript_5907:201-851(+)